MPLPRLSPAHVRRFRKTVYAHFARHGRGLPWRKTRDSYRILVSEVMLQQTQVDRVVPIYKSFIQTFPSFAALARAPLRRILLAWQGLGYNRRALALHRIAELVVKNHRGKLPSDERQLLELPGIGPYTARAVLAFAWNKPVAFMETNIRSVYLHHFFPRRGGIPDTDLVPLIEQTLDRKNPRRWYWALMDYGSALKRTVPNPNRRSAHHAKQSRFEGSLRQLRGLLLRGIAKQPAALEKNLLAKVPANRRVQARRALAALERDGFIKKTARGYAVAR